jgi:hypothetical protein
MAQQINTWELPRPSVSPSSSLFIIGSNHTLFEDLSDQPNVPERIDPGALKHLRDRARTQDHPTAALLATRNKPSIERRVV